MLSIRAPFLRPLHAAAAAALLATAPSAASAAEAGTYPTKPIRFIVPYSPGGGSDQVARLIGEKMAARLKQSIVIENRPGAGGNIGTAQATKAAPDGYTLVLASIAVTANPSIYKNLPFDITKDFEPVGTMASAPVLVVANAQVPVRTFAELVSYAKAHPGRMSYASSGTGTATHLAMEMLKDRTGIDIMHIPYKGSGTAITDVVGGQLQLFVATPTTVADFIKDGRLRLLVTLSGKRLDAYPDVPAAAETLPGFDASSWLGMMAPHGTPPAVVARLSDALRQSLEDEDTRRKLDVMGFVPDFRTPAEMKTLISNEIRQWAQVVKAAGIQAGN